MNSNVLILGAGASRPFGLPLLSQFFSDKEAQGYLITNKRADELLQRTFWGAQGRGKETAQDGLHIEEMISFLRDSVTLGWMPLEDLKETKFELFKLIAFTLHHNRSTKGAHLNPITYVIRATFARNTVATFNWDCLFEESFRWMFGSKYPSLAIKIRNWPSTISDDFMLLKLHGSISWWKDTTTDQIAYLAPGNKKSDGLATRWYSYLADDRDVPLILEPSVFKYSDSLLRDLRYQWELLGKRLREAECCIIIGYSLPDADQRTKTILFRARGENPNMHWIIITPDESVARRYRALLGDEKVHVLICSLEDLNSDIVARLSNAVPSIAWKANA